MEQQMGNAAAVMLILSTLAQGGEVITSRGELVEIGGSFRVPDIMELCGCHLREVGTTNKTHLSDYERAIGEQTRALLKVHTSNYRIVGFTESLPLSDIVALGCRTGLPVVEDLGSGSLVDLEHYGIHDEPTVQNSIRAGVDVVSFSGDKLLGGPQAGIILGKKPYIDRMKRHPLARAIRVDKMTIAALWATLTTYQDLHRAEQEIPTLAMLAVSGEDLRASAAQLCALLKERGVAAEVVAQSGPVGGGSVPTQLLPTLETQDVAAQAWKDNGAIYLADSMDEAIDISNDIAPEHLEVQVKDEREVAKKLLHYGSMFVGHYAPVAFGDFVSGPNHTLPTMRTARYSNGVWVGTFIKTPFHQFVSKEGCHNLAKHCMRFAEVEGLQAHRDSVKLRLED